MDSPKKIARIAGALYLIVVLSGLIHLMYVPSVINSTDPIQTLANITSNQQLFRLGILAGIVCYAAFLFLPIVLYRLLSPINKTHAVAMVTLALVSVPLSFVNMLHKFAVLTLINAQPALSADQIQTQVTLQLEYYGNGIQLTSIFWGLWLLPFGYLVFRSGFLPKVLGIFLMMGCFGYTVNFVGGFLSTSYSETIIPSILSIPSALGEIGICLWLLIVGVRNVNVNPSPVTA